MVLIRTPGLDQVVECPILPRQGDTLTLVAPFGGVYLVQAVHTAEPLPLVEVVAVEPDRPR